jgi:hypothetical protein
MDVLQDDIMARKEELILQLRPDVELATAAGEAAKQLVKSSNMDRFDDYAELLEFLRCGVRCELMPKAITPLCKPPADIRQVQQARVMRHMLGAPETGDLTENLLYVDFSLTAILVRLNPCHWRRCAFPYSTVMVCTLLV